MENKLPLLMTASVSTRGMKGALYSDAQRELMYVDALTYYIQNLLPQGGYKIVFAENSGWNPSSLIKKLPRYNPSEIEFISLAPDDFDITKGKGYNEVLMIHQAVSRSEFIKSAAGFFKVTGRYPVYNIKHFIDKASQFINRGGYLYADIKDHPIYDWLRLGWCGHSFECRLFGVNKSFYISNIAPLYKQCNDYEGRLLEGVMFDFLKQHPGNYSLRFKREPHFGGLEGSNIAAMSFSQDQDSIKSKLKRFIGNVIRTTMPFFRF